MGRVTVNIILSTGWIVAETPVRGGHIDRRISRYLWSLRCADQQAIVLKERLLVPQVAEYRAILQALHQIVIETPFLGMERAEEQEKEAARKNKWTHKTLME